MEKPAIVASAAPAVGAVELADLVVPCGVSGEALVHHLNIVLPEVGIVSDRRKILLKRIPLIQGIFEPFTALRGIEIFGQMWFGQNVFG